MEKATFKNVFRHIGFKTAVTPENDDGMDFAVWDIEKAGKSFGVAIVLTQRVLEIIFPLKNYLCPLGLIRAAEYPSGFIFSFYDKKTEPGNYYMVNLCSSKLVCNTNVIKDRILFIKR